MLTLKLVTLTITKHSVGTVIHNIELKPGKGGQLARSAVQVHKYLVRR